MGKGGDLRSKLDCTSLREASIALIISNLYLFIISVLPKPRVGILVLLLLHIIWCEAFWFHPIPTSNKISTEGILGQYPLSVLGRTMQVCISHVLLIMSDASYFQLLSLLTIVILILS